MAPSATEQPQTAIPVHPGKLQQASSTPATEKPWIKSSGILDQYESFDVTPVIGREFPHTNLVSWLQAPNSDELIKELALTISQRGVVFFRSQNNLTTELQKELIQRIGLLSGKPSNHGLHIHPILNPTSSSTYKSDDLEISTIDSELNKKLYANNKAFDVRQLKQKSGGWHSDIAFEPVPADYSSLRLVTLPKTGGDTLWASGYEILDRISPAVRGFLETLTATFSQPGFIEAAKRGGFEIYDKERGAPENVGAELKAVHPVVRTNPVTGWKSLFPVGGHLSHIDGVAEEESKALLKWFEGLLVENHELQVRFKWKNPNDIAIWDNRSTFHTATYDIEGQGERYGVRTVSIGEKPYFDADSKTRREALAAEAEAKA